MIAYVIALSLFMIAEFVLNVVTNTRKFKTNAQLLIYDIYLILGAYIAGKIIFFVFGMCCLMLVIKQGCLSVGMWFIIGVCLLSPIGSIYLTPNLKKWVRMQRKEINRLQESIIEIF